jgi:hypothetical protein
LERIPTVLIKLRRLKMMIVGLDQGESIRESLFTSFFSEQVRRAPPATFDRQYTEASPEFRARYRPLLFIVSWFVQWCTASLKPTYGVSDGIIFCGPSNFRNFTPLRIDFNEKTSHI